MVPELEELIISKGELIRLIGFHRFFYHCLIYYTILLILADTPQRFRAGELNSSIQAFGDREISNILEIVLNLLLKFINLIKANKFLTKYQNHILVNLLIEVKNHNKVLYQINVLDQLNQIGNSVSLKDRDKVIQALTITRSNLVQALKTEKILRENPGFRPETFSVDLTSLRSLNVEETTTEYSKLLNNALQIGIDIQEEIQKGFFKSNSNSNIILDKDSNQDSE